MMRGLITRGDHSIMHRANNWVAPRWVRLYVLGATRGGDGWLWYAMGFAILLFGGDQRFEALGAAGLSSVLSILLFIWLKRFTGRRRPCQIEPHCWATLLPPDQFSFPSGHTMTAFAVAIPLSSVLSGSDHRPAVLRAQYRDVAHPARHALPKRRGCGRADWNRPRIPGVLRVPVTSEPKRKHAGRRFRSARVIFECHPPTHPNPPLRHATRWTQRPTVPRSGRSAGHWRRQSP